MVSKINVLLIYFEKWSKFRKFEHLESANTRNNKTRQFASEYYCVTRYCFQKFTVAHKILCPLLGLKYTCLTFPCWHVVTILCFLLRSPIFSVTFGEILFFSKQKPKIYCVLRMPSFIFPPFEVMRPSKIWYVALTFLHMYFCFGVYLRVIASS